MNELDIMKKHKQLVNYIEEYIYPCIPKKNISIKIHMEDELMAMIGNIIRANVNSGNIRSKYIKEIMVNVSLLDYYMGYLKELNLVINKRFLSVIRLLGDINKLSIGWLNSEKNK